MKRKSIILISVIGGIVLIAIIVFVSVVFGGVYNVGVASGHSKPVEWVLRTTMENSVRNHAKNIEVPDNLELDDPEFYREYYFQYSGACVTCHGAPGQDPDPWMIIYPEASLLTDKGVVDQWSDAELYWILENGIKDSGMMSANPDHPKEDIWGVVAFVRQLPDMTPQEYEEIAEWYAETMGEKKEGYD